MSNALVTRLIRMERSIDVGNPLSRLSDEELEERSRACTNRIEARLGMTLSEYADELRCALENGRELPHDWAPEEARQFAHLVTQASR
ncbi:hypothetical protein [Pararhizobium sp.]|uniref:hypothetical protein n=1 Tax=Pararhizobium sp. TaxID=1977563 RepID=UPI002715C69C|nr:hypothetical protein [Pararhizobium sp.]MDO9416212.1 hypothetical protein [Pararhizobium sp.]